MSWHYPVLRVTRAYDALTRVQVSIPCASKDRCGVRAVPTTDSPAAREVYARRASPESRRACRDACVQPAEDITYLRASPCILIMDRDRNQFIPSVLASNLDKNTMDFRNLSTRDELVAYLQSHELFGLDSEYSPTMLGLRARFGAKGVHVNRWWVMTAVDWRCPACGRSKPEIVTLDRHDYLTGHLHRHHDHMENLVKGRFHEEAVKRKVVVADEVAARFAVRAAFGLSAFDETIICADCNVAEGRANKLAKTHRHFSFSPDEIRQFVDPAPNRSQHGIRIDIVKHIWEATQNTFMMRLEMVEKIASLAASNTHWYQPSKTTAAQVERLANWHFASSGLYELGRKLGVYDGTAELLYTTNVHQGSASSWRLQKVRRAAGKVPNEQDIELLRRTRGKYWDRVDASWRCPCCERTRFQCVRHGKESPWIFDIKEKALYGQEEERIALCEDCSNVASRIARELVELTRIELEHPSSIVGLAELRSIIKAQPHAHHDIDNRHVENLLPVLERRLLELEWEQDTEETEWE